MDNIGRIAAKGGIWLAGFKFTSQIISWAITVIVARILIPEDYGLMSMASVLTGYVEVISELGLGAAIIQKKELTKNELSSNFWFSIVVSCIFALGVFFLAYPTSWIFKEPRVIPITKLISVLFVINGIMVVPYNLLNREIRFKDIGIIQLSCTIIASLSMLMMARAGFGVWTLIWGTVVLRSVNLVLVFWFSKWRPDFHFMFSEVRPYLKFGINIAGSNSIFYVFNASIVFLVGRMLGPESLGYYNLASQLAKLPNSKIIWIIQQVSFPVFSRYQEDKNNTKDLYLKIVKYVCLFFSPLFLGGAFFGKELIYAILGEKWLPMAFIFRMMCLAEFVTSITHINNVIHNSQGRPYWVLCFQVINIMLIPVAVFVASKYGLHAVAIPWVTIYPMICFYYIWLSLRKLEISFWKYFMSFASIALAMISIMTIIVIGEYLINLFVYFRFNTKIGFLHEILIMAILYFLYVGFFHKSSLKEVWDTIK